MDVDKCRKVNGYLWIDKSQYSKYVEKQRLFYQKLFVAHIKDSLDQRYRELLAQHPEIVLRVPQHYIASFLGITSVSLTAVWPGDRSKLRHK